MLEKDQIHINQVDPDYDLCAIVIDRMTALGFTQKSIELIQLNYRFKQAVGKDTITQLTYLVLALNDILLGGPHETPYHIRLALNYSKHPPTWIDDIQTGVLPFMKANEEHFFA